MKEATPMASEPHPVDGGIAFPVVGFGASAGGLQALQEVLAGLPLDTGMAFIIISHLDPSHQSMLAPILAKSTRIPVKEVTEGLRVEADNVYVIPPNVTMIFQGGTLRLAPRGIAKHGCIDAFLVTLAREMRTKAIGVILSGTGSDGTDGCSTIKAEGGITFAQEESSAKFPQMPRSAVAAGCIDYVLSPSAIAEELIQVSRHPYLVSGSADDSASPPELDRELLAKIFKILEAGTGVDFSHYKQSTVGRRLARRMALHRVRHLGEYLRILEETPAENRALHDELLINVTSFFRDPDSFRALATIVFPAIVDRLATGEAIRIWVAGCATGEEAYSMAMAVVEFLEDEKLDFPVQIFATDVSEAAIARARAGIYGSRIVTEVSEERRQRFFVQTATQDFQVSKALRDLCIFARHDLIRDPPFSRLDLVSCRNVLIYMDPALQRRVIPVFHYALKPSGFLSLGPSESVHRFSELLETVDQQHKIFRRLPGRASVQWVHESDERARRPESAQAVGKKHPAEFELPREVDRIILSRYVPPGVVVGDDGVIVQFRGDTGPYLRPPSGSPNFELRSMLREDLFLDVESALREARESRGHARREGVLLRSEGHTREIVISVLPVQGPVDSPLHFVILFEEPAPRPVAKATGESSGDEPLPVDEPTRNQDNARLRREVAGLREELAASQRVQRSVIERLEIMNDELRASNEEALSGNEELQSANEEMETTREELESTNEELSTLNDELQLRNDELSTLNSDMANLVSSVNLAIAIVDEGLRLRRFTSAAEKLLNILPTDVGRPITDFRSNLHVDDLPGSIRQVIETLATLEQEVQDRGGRWYSMRMRPYRTLENRLAGAVLVWIDIHDMKAASSKLEQAHTLTEGIVETVRDPLLVLDSQLRVKRANAAFSEVFLVAKEEVEGRLVYDLGNKQWDIPRLRTLLLDLLPENSRIVNFEVEHDFEHIGHRTMLLNACRLQFASRAEDSILLAIEDVTERKIREGFAQATTILSQTLDIDAVLGHVTDLVIRYMADWCCVYLTEENGVVRRAALAHRDRTRVQLLETILDGNEADGDLPFRWSKTLRTGEPDLMTEIHDSALEAIARDSDHLRGLRALQLNSSLSVPIAVRGKTIGVLALACAESRRRLGLADLALAEELAQRVGLAIDNAKQYRRAQEAVREREEFMSVASHELKTPLTTLQLASQCLMALAHREESGLRLAAEHIEMLKKIERQSQRLADLVNNLLDVSRIRSGTLDLVVEEIDLQATVRAVAERHEEELARKHVAMVIPFHQPVKGRWDRLRIEQVITNLISNAIKYGNGKQISVTVLQEHSKAILKVADLGIGIAPAAMAKLFQPFQRFAPQSYTGVGLGLYIVRRIVDAHGGSITVTSRVGEGSTFTVELPLTSVAVAREPPSNEEKPS